jgi:ribosomal protein S18 acetylase RimI-like enzyme
LYRKPRNPAREKDHILGLIADNEVGFFVAEAAGVVIGFVNVTVCESPPVPILVPRRYAAVENLVVDPRFQRAGVGRELMDHVHRWAADQGASEVELTVYRFNEAALAFYESLGYTHVSSRMHKPLEQGSP